MTEFSHEELQKVILRYDAEFKRVKKASMEQEQRANSLEEAMLLGNKELKELREMGALQQEEAKSLKQHV